ncbi:uncharacterized protein C2845_PM02G19650 [Panicum miliaceum]|uniref:Myb/SANT-like domain-containing protein n=1 Tax=Panicum miliaceum TaxID=4540 RepID=A0A3L6SBW6_PANMI|nr:uncharacterized protein C2845_PM02G19650 [Panicum miliaceum]
MVPGLVVVLAVRRQHQPVWWQTTTSVSLLGQAEVHEDVVVLRRVILLLPLRHANSDHLVRLEVKAIRASQLVVSPTPPSMRDDLFDKADLSNSANNAAFCELCVEKIRAGDTNNGHMTNRGYTNIAAKFEERKGYVALNDSLRTDGMPLDAYDAWWKKHIKGHGEWRKLCNGPPENLAELQIMFQNIAVDGSSSCIPGRHMSEGHEGDEDDLGDGSHLTI